MAVPKIRDGMRPDANLFTRTEIGRYLRRFKMHLQAGAADSVVNLACEIRETIEQRQNADPDTIYLAEILENEDCLPRLLDRGIATVGDVLRLGEKAFSKLYQPNQYRAKPIWRVCQNYIGKTRNFEQ